MPFSSSSPFLSRFGDARNSRSGALQRCGVTLVWTGLASGSSSEPQAKRMNCCPFRSKSAHVIMRSARVSPEIILPVQFSRQGKASTQFQRATTLPATSVPVIPFPHAHCSCSSPSLSPNDKRCIVGAKTLPQMFELTHFSPSRNQVCGRACAKRWPQTHGETSEIRDVMSRDIAKRGISRNFPREDGSCDAKIASVFFPITWS